MSRNVVPCTQPAGQGNHFDLIPTVQMESQHSVGVPTYRDFPRFVIISEKSRPEVGSRVKIFTQKLPFWKKTLTGKFSKIVFRKDSWRHRSTSCVQIWWNLADRKSVKSCVIYLTKNSARSPALVSARIAPKICQGNIPRIPQILSKSVHFRRSYSRTREHRWNAPWSVSNTRRSYSFFAE